ncbi:DUF4381 domain-containing protein [Vibrio sp. SS-MA-C1-2]|uniref:DUF4381 domain-containing protein n=1 Tax=Vibrio sp. SS-MA-C1-2 TaxID=2908646 RepID=UPI001F2083A6|nr:DUF4381 domain-containing protein [Vibrio sp. SS-MA-C1-2]
MLTVDENLAIKSLMRILKKAAILVYPYDFPNGLYHHQWFDFLDSKVDQPLFSEQIRDYLIKVDYRPNEHFNSNLNHLAIAAAVNWLKQHKEER